MKKSVRFKVKIHRIVSVLENSDKNKLIVFMSAHILLGIIDLVGVILFGILGAVAFSGIGGGRPGQRVLSAMALLNLDQADLKIQITFIGALACFVMLLRTYLSIKLTRKTFNFLGSRSASLANKLISGILGLSMEKINHNKDQENVYALTTGVTLLMLGVIGTLTLLVSDIALLIILTLGLLLVNPIIATLTMILMSLLAYIVYSTLEKKARTLGRENATLTIDAADKILEVLHSFREATVRGRKFNYADEITANRKMAANYTSEIAFLPFIGKYVIEGALVVGVILIGGSQFFFQDPYRAVTTLTIFLAASSRIAPAILRIQQGAVLIKTNLGGAESTLKLFERVDSKNLKLENVRTLNVLHAGFQPEIEVDNLYFSYPKNSHEVLSGVSLKIGAGEMIAVVGPSGAGKSTFADLCIGLWNPNSGRILLSGLPPEEAILKWPGAIAYIPQDVSIFSGTIRENITLGFRSEDFTDYEIWKTLETAQLSEWVESQPQALDSKVGERGTRMSGGQRQRLGLARALITNPKMIFLDEATSALDGSTEKAISLALERIRGKTTLIMIAHRLSTVRNASKVLYFEDGRVIAEGKFQDVRNQIKNFDEQAKLMGL